MMPPEAEENVLAKRRKTLLRHIDGVRQNCIKLGESLIEKGEPDVGHQLIANGYMHDQSKFHGAEWLYLWDDVKTSHPDLFKAALLQHNTTNLHHPEAWTGGIHAMDRLYRAEMVCDWAARSSEMQTNTVSEFLKDVATKKWDMAIQSNAYRELKELIGLLLDPAFK